ncbi:GNAT family N-acetyltransferase [Azospirillum agricola]|uniref:GNAT family N-acetyltransferase n=1 Tax=Azospirillum agricola TaxID=1720247 RepID=UPI000A0EF918|nr:GNAT family N-acetyltransferase [Azospirillum agricola]SMH59595.1 Acetyltransferase (GNAT) family protein [Azospirillum lipoferum]
MTHPPRIVGDRPLTDADIPTVCGFPRNAEELYFLFPRATWPLTPGQVRASLAERRDPTVAILDGQAVGYANFVAFEEGRTTSLGNLAVDPRRRRQGIAEHLVRTMMERAFSVHDLPEMTLSCFNTNTPGLLLYAKLGMTPIGLTTHVAPWGDTVALLKLRMTREAWRGGAVAAS